MAEIFFKKLEIHPQPTITLLCLIVGGGGVKLHFLKFFTPKSVLLWSTQIKEFSRKSYPLPPPSPRPPFNYHPLILWNFLVKLSSAKVV